MPEDIPRLASLAYRGAARVVDLFLIAIAFIVVGSLVASRLEEGVPRNPYLADLVVYGVWAAYEVIPVAVWGRTVGKAVLQLRVVRLPDLRPPGMSRSFIRWVVPAGASYVLGSVPLPLGYLTGALVLLIYLYAFVNPMRQGLHDRASGTVVTTQREP